MDLTQKVTNVVIAKACSIKPDKDSDESKTITLKVKFDGVDLSDVFAKAVSGAVIQWQNGPGRSKFDTWMDKQTVNIDFKSPARAPTIGPETAMVAKLQNMDTDEDRMKYLNDMMRKANK